MVPGRFCAPNPRARALLPLGIRRSPVSEPASPQLGWQCPQLARERRPPLLYHCPWLFIMLLLCPCPHGHLTPPAGSPLGLPPAALSALPTSPDTRLPPFSTALLPCLFSPQPACQASLLQEPPGARPTLLELTIGTQTCVWLQHACVSVWVRLPAENGCSLREGEKWAEGWAGCSLGM